MQAPAALPHQAISAPSVATLRQLDALRSENAVLTEMVKAAELRSKLSPAQSGAQTSAPKPSPQVRPGDAARALQVVSVYGLDGELTAVIQLPGGGVVKTHAGTALPGIGRVTTVAHNEVVVTTVGGPVALPFAPVQVGEH
jgi:type IV pilus biogenesis protein PilP